MSQIVPQYPQNHDFMSELARHAGTQLIEYKGNPYISMVAVIALFMDDDLKRNPRQRWNEVKKSMLKAEIELYERIVQLKVLAQDGKMRLTDCGNVIAVKRVLMYIRDKKPEGLRMEILKRSDQLLTFTQQNLFEGRNAYENEFYSRTLPMFDDDLPHEDRGYHS